MPNKIRVIEITEQGVHMRGDEVEVLQLADGTTREVRKRGYAKALGIKDFNGDRAAMLEEAQRIAGRNIAELATENSRLSSALNDERQEKERITAEREAERRARHQAEQAILAERAEKAQLANQLEQARADVQRAGLQQKPQQGGRE